MSWFLEIGTVLKFKSPMGREYLKLFFFIWSRLTVSTTSCRKPPSLKKTSHIIVNMKPPQAFASLKIAAGSESTCTLPWVVVWYVTKPNLF
jgi:hypothetical protein